MWPRQVPIEGISGCRCDAHRWNYCRAVLHRSPPGLPLIVLATWAWIFTWTGAVVRADSTSAESKPGDPIAAIAAQLKSSDPAEREAGISAVRQRLRTGGEKAAKDFIQSWQPALLETMQYDTAADLSLEAILVGASDLNTIAELQNRRVSMLLTLGRKGEALQAAKGLYNVCWMRKTPDAINLLDDVLIACDPDEGPKKATQLEEEQIAGADAQPAEDSGAQTKPASILAEIHVDAGPYEKRLAQLERHGDYASLYARGNLLLLADRPQEAMKVFREAYSLAPKANLVAATEAMARAMKAEDGRTGRADAWILSLRPESQLKLNSAQTSAGASQ